MSKNRRIAAVLIGLWGLGFGFVLWPDQVPTFVSVAADPTPTPTVTPIMTPLTYDRAAAPLVSAPRPVVTPTPRPATPIPTLPPTPTPRLTYTLNRYCDHIYTTTEVGEMSRELQASRYTSAEIYQFNYEAGSVIMWQDQHCHP